MEMQSGSNYPPGLTNDEARRHKLLYGPNIITENQKTNLLSLFLARFKNPLILLLLAASFISLATGNAIDASVIIVIISVSISVDFFQEYRSDQAAQKLKQKVLTRAVVIRNNQKMEIPVVEVTVGDVIVLTAGNIIPADLEITFARDLHIDESVMTGESFPAEKHPGEKLLMGTSVVNGEGLATVLAIGKNTGFGQIAEKLQKNRPQSSFEIGIKDFGILVVRFTLILAAAIFLINGFLKHDFLSSLIFSLALAVGLTPELLPMIITLNLAKGALKMAKNGVIIKHLPVIENLGSMTILCTDKTGTLTENKVILEKYQDTLGRENDKVLLFAYLNSAFQSNVRNPLDEAIMAHQNDVNADGWTKIDEIPFDFTRKRLSVVLENKNQHHLICKGAVDSVLQICSNYEDGGKIKPLTKSILAKVQKLVADFNGQGYRVLAIATGPILQQKTTYLKDSETGLTLLGITAFLDPPKADAKQTIKDLISEGVELKILTGDNELVTATVCAQLNIPVKGIVTGNQIDKLSESELLNKCPETTIFARLNPDQKDKIITLLRRAGKVVGYLGDGINDANSLRLADVGISVENGVDVAKESADIILVTKSLRVLRVGILDGRRTFANTQKYIFMGTSSNFGNMLSVSLASIFLPFIPMLPAQILLNNLLYDLSQLAIPEDHVDLELIKKPLAWNVSFIKKFVLYFGPISSLFDLLTFGVLLWLFRASTPAFRTGWFLESAITQGLIIFSIRTFKVPFFKSRPSLTLGFSSILTISVAIIISQTGIGRIFQFIPLPWPFWLFVAAVVPTYFILVEVMKSRFRLENQV